MIVGYIDHRERVVCADCWRRHADVGARPAQVLDSDDPRDPDARFWVVDACTSCGRRVEYQDAMPVN